MSSRIKIASAIVLGVLTVFLSVVLWRSITGRFGFGGARVETDADLQLVQEKTFPAEEISSFQIKYNNFMSIRFYENTEETILVREYLNFEPAEDQLAQIEIAEKTLSVQGPKKAVPFFSLLPAPQGCTEIWLPVGLYDSLLVHTVSGDILSEIPFTLSGSLSVESTSGQIRIVSASGSRVDFSSVSGDLDLGTVDASDNASFSTTSGQIRVVSASGSRVGFSSVSGDLGLGTVDASGNASFSTTSGQIRVASVSGSRVGFSSVSGDLDLGTVDASGNTSFSTTSGQIRVASVSGSRVSFSSASSDLDLGTVDASDRLEADTTSGDILLKTLNAPFCLSTTSGDITIESGVGSGEANSVSGRLNLTLDQGLTGSLTLGTSSGDIILSVPESDSFYLDFHSTSGSCDTFFDDKLSFSKKGHRACGQYGGDSANRLQVSTTSGDLRILRTN